MKTLNNTTYSKLSTQQRVRATISAIGRGDENERRKLIDSSVTDEYSISKVSAIVSDINALSMAIRLSLLESLSEWLCAYVSTDQTNTGEATTRDLIQKPLKNCASVIKARDQWLNDYGISHEDYEVYDAPISGVLQTFINASDGHACDEVTLRYFTEFKDYFKRRHP